MFRDGEEEVKEEEVKEEESCCCCCVFECGSFRWLGDLVVVEVAEEAEVADGVPVPVPPQAGRVVVGPREDHLWLLKVEYLYLEVKIRPQLLKQIVDALTVTADF